MTAKQTSGAQDRAPEAGGNGDGQGDNSLADKLSKELSNWCRQRREPEPRRLLRRSAPEGQSEPARTIRVRGYETLVVRKPKLVSKPPSNAAPENS